MTVWWRNIGSRRHEHFKASHLKSVSGFVQIFYFQLSNPNNILLVLRIVVFHGKLLFMPIN